jgi:hypothetical protein
MNYKSKYVILDTGYITPIVFTDLLQHVDVANGIGGTVIAAGFCYIQDGRYVCYGESVSLRVKTRGAEDEKILNKYLGVDYE